MIYLASYLGLGLAWCCYMHLSGRVEASIQKGLSHPLIQKEFARMTDKQIRRAFVFGLATQSLYCVILWPLSVGFALAGGEG